jgi:hypothetical protein
MAQPSGNTWPGFLNICNAILGAVTAVRD